MTNEVLARAPTHVFALVDELFVVVWRTAPTTLLVQRLGATLERAATARPNGFDMVVIIEAAAEMPDSPVRELMARDMKRHESFTRSMGIVYEGSGFRAATVRSVLAGIQLLSRHSTPNKVFARVDEWAVWLAGRRGPQDAAGVVARLRADA